MTRGNLFLGVLLIGLGGLLLAGQAGLTDPFLVIARGWPALVILAGVAQLLTRPRNVVGGTILLTIGAILLAWTLGLIAGIAMLWPVALIALGIWLIVGRRLLPDVVADLEADPTDVVAVFDNREVRPSGTFAGGSATAVFGDLRLDLRGADHPGVDVTLQATAVFGDLHLDVPDAWQVHVRGPELLGDVHLEEATPPDPQMPRLTVRVVTLLGDLHIRRLAVVDPKTPTAASAARIVH